MAEEHQSPGPVPVLMILILLATVGSAAFLGRSLISARPDQKFCETEARRLSERADARLWQDPLAAVQDHLDHLRDFPSKPEDSIPLEAKPDTICSLESLADPAARFGRFLTLAVLLDGGRYEENRETRLRTRYAVLSALADKKFTPVDPTHITYSKFDFVSFQDSLIVPYEALVRSPTAGNAADAKGDSENVVLVLWINETHIEDHLTEYLDELLVRQRGFRVAVIGPFASDGLVNLVSADSVRNSLTVYSPWATTPEALLPKKGRAASCGRINVIRVLKDDFQLMKLLVPELKARGVKFKATKSDTSNVALISEWDTAYGRAITKEFVAAVRAGVNSIPIPLKAMTTAPQDSSALVYVPSASPDTSWVREFHYFRGIDGVLPQEESSAASTPKSNSEDRSKEPERPEGQSQLDYIRSLARRLGEQKVEAVGVFGTDVYDKLLIIQAIREYVPSALIFTTDLDSRLWHSSQLKWTRNVIVASAVDLQPNLLWSFGDYRYSYQTAIYQAVSAAWAGDSVFVPPPAAVYEIGKTGPEPLQNEAYSVHPFILGAILKWPLASPETFFFLGALPLLLLITAGLALSGNLWGSGHGRTALLVYLGGLFLLLGGASLFFLLSPVMEPFPPPVVGISTWPTEIIRSFNYLLALVFLVSSLASLDRTARELSWRFFPKANPSEKEGEYARPSGSILLRVFLPFYNQEIQPLKDESTGNGETFMANAGAEWRTYQYRMSRKPLVTVLAILTGLYLVAFGLVFSLFKGLHVPTRGGASFGFDRFVIILNVVSLILLIALTLYSALTCRALIVALGKRPTKWPTETLKSFEEERIPREVLGEWLDIRLIAEVTHPVDRLVIFPFLILTILIFSRLPFFDRWSWPLPLIIVFALELTSIVVSLFMVRHAALKAKEEAIRHIEAQLRLATAKETSEALGRAAAIRLVRDEIVAYRKGTFGPLSRHPVMIALLMPFGGLGTVVIFNLLSRL